MKKAKPFSRPGYAVKTLYVTTCRGSAKLKSRAVPAATMVEERVVYFASCSQTEARKRALKEAKEHAAYTFRNGYGQQVVTRFVGISSLCVPIEGVDGRLSGELFHETTVIEGDVALKSLMEWHGMRPRRNLKNERILRSQFLNREFSNPEKYINAKT